MKIYNEEKSIANLIQTHKTIAYTASIETTEQLAVEKLDEILKNHHGTLDIIWPNTPESVVSASIHDRELFYHTSILVTTNCNKNGDVFRPEIVWAARQTPVHKPTNLEHNSNKIIGHMTGSWAIDTERKIIDDKTEASELPSKFHILVGSVIYKYWPDNEEYSVQVAALLESIEKGEKYVSMECRFEDFDYALISNANENDVRYIARNEETAFLSKHIKSYGGDGTWNNYKVGRAIKDISFIGKGYVDKPANPESVIFTKEDVFDFAQANFSQKIDFSENVGVVLKSQENLKEKSIMSEFYQEQAKKLEDANQALATQLDELKEKLAQSTTVALEKKVASLEVENVDINKALKAEQDKVSEKDKTIAELQKQVESNSKANDELTKLNQELADKFAAYEAAAKIQARVALLVAGGFPQEDAEKEVSAFANLDDNQFKSFADRILEAAKFMFKKPGDKDKEDKKEEHTECNEVDVDAAEITDEEVVSASDSTQDTEDEEFTSLVKNLTASLKIGDK